MQWNKAASKVPTVPTNSKPNQCPCYPEYEKSSSKVALVSAVQDLNSLESN